MWDISFDEHVTQTGVISDYARRVLMSFRTTLMANP